MGSDKAALDGHGYSSENMHKRYYYNFEYRYRRYDDIQVGDFIGRINAPDRRVEKIYPVPDYSQGFPFTPGKVTLQFSRSLFDTRAEDPSILTLVRRRPGEVFRVPKETEYA